MLAFIGLLVCAAAAATLLITCSSWIKAACRRSLVEKCGCHIHKQ